MKWALSIVAGCLAFSSVASAQAVPGYDGLTVTAPHRGKPIAASVWYPAGQRTYRGLIGDNPVFKGETAFVGAPVAAGRHPLLLLSHGSGGNMDALAWLSARLALRGAMILAVNHPGSTTGDSSPRRSIRLDERAADLRAALDALLSDPFLAPHVDTARVASLGFSLGGTTALNLAGARLNRGLYKNYCARSGDQADCVFLAKGGVSLTTLPDSFENDMHDPRITAAIAVDPGLTHGFTDESLEGIGMPVLLINLGISDRWKAADVSHSGSNLTGRLPRTTYTVVEPAHHFSFLAECKAEGRRLLAEEKDDPVCDDPAGADRARVHAEIVESIAAFMGL